MTKIHEQIEDMQRRLTESAITEREFVEALGEALNQVDQHLLNEVRRLSSEHEGRRGTILNELQSLSDRLCLFPAPPEAVTTIDHSSAQDGQRHIPASGETHAPGDWRKATSVIEDDIDTYWRSPGPNH